MNEKVYKTSFSFPVVKCDLRIESNKVKKPSGITYIILELIKSYSSKGTHLKDELLLFGIPKELHYIFSREISFLCRQNIIIYNGGSEFNSSEFNSCYINDFTFSDFGLKVFKEGVIPTEERRKYPISIYYDMVTNIFWDNKQPKGKISKSDNSIYSEFRFPEVTDNMINFEDIFEDNRKQFKVKPEEIFKEGALTGQEGMILEISDSLKVKFNYTKVSFEFGDNEKTTFFKNRLNGKILENHFLKQKKFDFEKLLHNNYSIPEKDMIPLLGDVVDIHIPSEMPDILRKKTTIVFDRNLFIMNNADKKTRIGKELSDRVLDEVDSCVVAALVDKDDIRLICPIKMSFFNDEFNEYIPINIIYEIKANEEYSQKLYNAYIEYAFSSEYTTFNAKILSLIADISNNEGLLERYLYYLKDQNQKNYSNIVAFNGVVKNINGWSEIFHNFVKTIFEENKAVVNNDNLSEIHDLLKPLKDSIDMSDVEFIRYLTTNIDVKENYDILFYTFEQYKYKAENIMPSINIVEIYMKNILAGEGVEDSVVKNKIESDFKKFDSYFDNLIELLEIESYLDVVKETFDNEEYQDNYKAFIEAQKAIEKYRNFAPTEFLEIDEYAKVFEAVHDVVVMELLAMKDAKAITKEYIENLILKADLKNAVCDMHIRLQDFVLDYYKENKYSSEMVERLMDDDVISEDTMDILFQLVRCRNGLQHPKNRSVNFSKDDVILWCNTLYEVIERGEDTYESSSED